MSKENRVPVPPEVKDAVDSFKVPINLKLRGWEKCEIPKERNKNRSNLWFFGVKLTNPKVSYNIWKCMASSTCKSTGTSINMSKGCSSNIVDHLRYVHGILSTKTLGTVKKKRSVDEAYETDTMSTIYKINRGRFTELKFVFMVIECMLPFQIVEADTTRSFFRSSCIDEFNSKMCRNRIRHLLIEIYESIRYKFSCMIKEVVKKSSLPCIHLNIDMWKSKTSGKKFIGVRLYFIDFDWNYRSYLIAIKHFNPSSEVNSKKRLSELLGNWLEEILEEFGLEKHNIFGCTSDAGSDVKRYITQILEKQWEWCVPHMLNRATKEAFGDTEDARKSRNKECRKLLVSMKQICKDINSSDIMRTLLEEIQVQKSGKSNKIVTYARHRFLGIADLFETVLDTWDCLITVYQKCNKSFPLLGKKDILCQLYSLLSPITSISVEAQSELIPKSLKIVTDLFKFRVTTLVPHHPIKLWNKDKVYDKHELLSLTEETREKILKSLEKRFYNRYDIDQIHSRSYVFEMGIFLYPPLKKLKIIEKMVRLSLYQLYTPEKIKERIKRIKDIIKSKVCDLALIIAKEVVKEFQPMQCNLMTTETEPLPEFLNKQQYTLKDLSFTSDQSDDHHIKDDHHKRNQYITPTELVEQEMESYMREKVTETDLPIDEVLNFWRDRQNTYKCLSNVARVVYGLPASSGGIERDFGIAGLLLSPLRSRLDPIMVEIMMFLNRNIGLINIDHIRELSNADVESIMNIRRQILRDLSLIDDPNSDHHNTFFDDLVKEYA